MAGGGEIGATGPPTALDDAWSVDDLDDAPIEALDDTTVLQEVAEQTSYGQIFLNDLVRRQRRLALSVAGVFLLLLFGLPLVNLAFPQVAGLPVLGLPLSWLILAVLVYPLLLVLAWYFTTTARALEDEFVDLVR